MVWHWFDVAATGVRCRPRGQRASTPLARAAANRSDESFSPRVLTPSPIAASLLDCQPTVSLVLTRTTRTPPPPSLQCPAAAMSAPVTRSSGRLGHEGNEDAEPEHHKGAGSRGRKEAQRLQNDVDRILQQPTNADRKRTLHNSVRKWQNGAAFEQCWIGKVSERTGG